MLRRTFLISPLGVAAAQYEESRGETPWVPSPDEVIETMLRLAKVGRGDVVYDLGCGDGRVVIMAAQKFVGQGGWDRYRASADWRGQLGGPSGWGRGQR